MDADLWFPWFESVPRRHYSEVLAPLVRTSLEWPPQEHRIDWSAVEEDLNLRLPESYKRTSEVLPAGTLWPFSWCSPVAKRKEYRLDRQSLMKLADLCAEITRAPLFPAVPGYLEIASAPSRLSLYYQVIQADGDRPTCLPEVVLMDCGAEEKEFTGVEIDEFFYRFLTNNPPLKGELSQRVREHLPDDSEGIPFFWAC